VTLNRDALLLILGLDHVLKVLLLHLSGFPLLRIFIQLVAFVDCYFILLFVAHIDLISRLVRHSAVLPVLKSVHFVLFLLLLLLLFAIQLQASKHVGKVFAREVFREFESYKVGR
jgi:hypothetical protein